MTDLLCFSHLRWNFVFQRPQHLLTRFAKKYRTFYFEEPIHNDKDDFTIAEQDGLYVVQLLINNHHDNKEQRLAKIITKVLKKYSIKDYICWYYTPMALAFTRHLNPQIIIYDAMDELSAFKFAPAELVALEDEMLRMSDIVFTGGHSLYHAKKNRHHNIHAFPSSIDKKHFGQARTNKNEPLDQAHIPHPRFGFYGVIDERFDIHLLRAVANERPEWQFIIIGPVVKISEEELPKSENIHYLGSKQYAELPLYVSHWDIAMVLFALNESTKYISPTKTPEYLASGIPVISTPITDIINPYGTENLVHIVSNSAEFIAAAEIELAKKDKAEWLHRVDQFLENNSWDSTFEQMEQHINSLYNIK